MEAWITEKDFFQKYRYKKRKVEGKKIWSNPYISKKDSSTHEYAMTVDEWHGVIKEYWNIVVDRLIEGDTFQMPREMGTLELVRKRGIRKNNTHVYRNLHTQGFYPYVVWKRWRNGRFLHKMWYRFNISTKKQWSKVSKALYKEPSLIYKYHEDINKHE